MFLRQHRDCVSADLVCHVAIRGNPVSSYNNGVDLTQLHQRARHIVGNHGCGNAIFHQFPRSQPRALKKRASFVCIHVNFLAFLHCRADDAQSSTVPAGGKRSGVTVREHTAIRRHQRSSELAHSLVSSDILCMHSFGFVNERLLDLWQRPNPQSLEFISHPPYCPKQIHCGRPSVSDQGANIVQLPFEFADTGSFGVLHAQRDSHSSGHPNGRCAAYYHRPNYIRYLFVRLTSDIGLFHWQLRLVDEAHAGVGPFESFDHQLIVRIRLCDHRSGCGVCALLPGGRKSRILLPRP